MASARLSVAKLRWILLGLYLGLILLLMLLISAGSSGGDLFAWIVLLGFTFAAQLLFVLIPGRTEYLTPTRPRRLIVPALIAGLMMTVLLGTLLFAVGELLEVDGGPTWPLVLFWSVLGLSWIAWTILFFAYARRMESYRWVKRMVAWLLGGSLAQLLATVPSHLTVTRRPGCFVGMWTAMGLFGGLYVMCWAFGPGIALLFWAETRKRTAGHCPGCGYNLRGLSEQRCPECGRPFTFAEIRMTPEDLKVAE
jgi:hypothetical protein